MKKLLYLGLIVLFASCVKQPAPEPVGEIKVRFVNALETSVAQDMFIRGAKIPNSVAVLYGQASPYAVTTSGDNAFAFANMGTTEGVANAGVAGKFEIGDKLSIYYSKKLLSQGGGLIAALKYDDPVTVPDKAKVSFIHLNHNLNNVMNFLTEDGEVLHSMGFGLTSKYFALAPGTKIKINAATVTEPLLIDPLLEAGKNYTIWVDGPSETVLVAHVAPQD
ncbi:MAG TPA: DUF4397 domain-containing protein [Pedobacter sp.]|nr:DUF4397 domain-containing protein [Pedobacter sp.]